MTEEEKTPLDIQIIQIRYKGFEIQYNEYFEEYRTIIDDREISKNTLKAAKERIDDFLKKEKAFKPFPALMRQGYDSFFQTTFKEVIVTSGNSEKAWVRDSKGERSKVSTKSLYQDTETNRSLIYLMKRDDEAMLMLKEGKEACIKDLKNIEI